MGVTCSCFGKSQSDSGVAEGSDGVKGSFMQKVVTKVNLYFEIWFLMFVGDGELIR